MRLPVLSAAPCRTLAVGVLGTMRAGSAWQSAVIGALLLLVGLATRHAPRPR